MEVCDVCRSCAVAHSTLGVGRRHKPHKPPHVGGGLPELSKFPSHFKDYKCRSQVDDPLPFAYIHLNVPSSPTNAHPDHRDALIHHGGALHELSELLQVHHCIDDYGIMIMVLLTMMDLDTIESIQKDDIIAAVSLPYNHPLKTTSDNGSIHYTPL